MQNVLPAALKPNTCAATLAEWIEGAATQVNTAPAKLKSILGKVYTTFFSRGHQSRVFLPKQDGFHMSAANLGKSTFAEKEPDAVHFKTDTSKEEKLDSVYPGASTLVEEEAKAVHFETTTNMENELDFVDPGGSTLVEVETKAVHLETTTSTEVELDIGHPNISTDVEENVETEHSATNIEEYSEMIDQENPIDCVEVPSQEYADQENPNLIDYKPKPIPKKPYNSWEWKFAQTIRAFQAEIDLPAEFSALVLRRLLKHPQEQHLVSDTNYAHLFLVVN